eukprot:6174247-Pleurochrysis_carterae.AAC.4
MCIRDSAHTLARSHARSHARTHARTHAHAHARTHAHPEEAHVRALVLEGRRWDESWGRTGGPEEGRRVEAVGGRERAWKEDGDGSNEAP